MIRALDEMTVMANGLVAYARGAGEAKEAQTIDLASILGRLGEERGAEFHAREEVRATGRPVDLGRAIGNVVDNAIRYGGRTGCAGVTGIAVVTVEDDGPGIPDVQLAAVFEPFVRGDDSRNAETRGAGLGLATARTVVATRGGAIALEFRPEGGLRATTTLLASGAVRGQPPESVGRSGAAEEAASSVPRWTREAKKNGVFDRHQIQRRAFPLLSLRRALVSPFWRARCDA